MDYLVFFMDFMDLICIPSVLSKMPIHALCTLIIIPLNYV